MKNTKYKHLTFEHRCIIKEFLDFGYNFSHIANRIGKNRSTVSKEVFKRRFILKSHSSNPLFCLLLHKPPYVCNGCVNKLNCRKIKFSYDPSIAHNQYIHDLSSIRSTLKISKDQISSINDVISPLMIHKHHSINHVYISHPDLLPFSKSTFYRYIDSGILNVRNIDLQRKVNFKVKKEYDYSRSKINTSIKIGRFYSDFKDYLEFHPSASIVEMDTVIGTTGGKGGKCFLTLLFRQFNFMLIFLLPYKKSQFVSEVFLSIKDSLGSDEFKRLFEVILTDNGTEFSDPNTIEIDIKTGEKISSVFYCEPNCSWQKGSIEKNHEYIRYILPKGTSFSTLKQSDCDLLASHINSTPRLSLNNQSPYDYSLRFLGQDTINKFHISKIEYDDIDLSPRLLKK